MQSLSIPFSLDGYGRIRSTTSQEKIYADRVRLALMTIPGERVMRPQFGSPIPEQSFESPEDIPDEIEAGVRQAFADFLPDLTLEEIEVTWEDVEAGTVTIELTYSAPTTRGTLTSNLSLTT